MACHGCRDYVGQVHGELPSAGHANAGAFYGDQRNATWQTGWTFRNGHEADTAKIAAEHHGKLDGWVHSLVAQHPDAQFHTLSHHDAPIFGHGHSVYDREYFEARDKSAGSGFFDPQREKYFMSKEKIARLPYDEAAMTLNGSLVRCAVGYKAPDLSQAAGVVGSMLVGYMTLGAFGIIG